MDNKTQQAFLPRKLGFADAYFLVIGSVFGTGIFLTSGLMAVDCPSPLHMLLAWFLGGAIALAGALTFSELGTLFPRAGGPYVYLRESFGPLAAFLYGWGFFWIIGCGGIAALSSGFVEALRPFVSFLDPARSLLKDFLGEPWSIISNAGLASAAAIIAVSIPNLFGVKTGARIQNGLVLLRGLALVVFVGFGLALAFGGRAAAGVDPARIFRTAPVSLTGFGAAFLAVLWTYDGWYSAAIAAEEVRRPRTVLSAALGLGTLTLTALFILTHMVYSMALPVKEMKGVVRVGEAAALRLFGPAAASGFAALVAVSALGCLSANVLFCARVPFAMARDGLFWRRFAAVHPRRGVPSAALILQMVVASLLCLTGSFQKLYEFVVFALTLFFAAAAAAVIVLRIKKPGLERPYRVPGYPFVPVIFALVNAVIFVLSAISRPFLAAAAAGVLLLGLPAYLVWRRRLPGHPAFPPASEGDEP